MPRIRGNLPRLAGLFSRNDMSLERKANRESRINEIDRFVGRIRTDSIIELVEVTTRLIEISREQRMAKRKRARTLTTE